MTEKEMKNIPDGGYVLVDFAGDLFIGPIQHKHQSENLVMFYSEFGLNQNEWNLETTAIDASNIVKHLPELVSIDDQIKRLFPQYFI